MGYLRYALLILSVCGAITVIAALVAEGSRLPIEGALILIGIGVALVANFVYVLEVAPDGAARLGLGRIGRMFRLWFDAKERDLAKRVTPAD